VNIEETSSGYDIHMAAPGLSRGDFKIHTDSGYLTISAEANEKSEEGVKRITQEYTYTTFSRSWKLPSNANSEAIAARYDAGVLTVSIPIATKKSSRVEIKVD
jgi:HSP20 family protein